MILMMILYVQYQVQLDMSGTSSFWSRSRSRGREKFWSRSRPGPVQKNYHGPGQKNYHGPGQKKYNGPGPVRDHFAISRCIYHFDIY